MEKRIGKKDLILLAVVLAAALIVWGGYRILHQGEGMSVVVTVDGETYGTYDLHSGDTKANTIDITVDGKVTNTLVIEDGTADVVTADCPDLLCVHQKAISKPGETIVCLPNKVVVEIAGDSSETKFDTIAQ